MVQDIYRSMAQTTSVTPAATISTKTTTTSKMKGNFLPALTGGFQLFNAFQEFNAPDVDYDVLQLSATQKELEASNLELNIEQEANFLREQFIEQVGAAQHGAARRGVKVGEGNIQENIEESAGNVGKDIQTARGNVEFKAGLLRSAADRYRSAAEGVKEVNYWNRVGGLAENLGKAAQSFSLITGGGIGKDGTIPADKKIPQKKKAVKKKKKKSIMGPDPVSGKAPTTSYTVVDEAIVQPNVLNI